MPTKVDKVNIANQLYGTDASGEQTTYEVSASVKGLAVVKRIASGQIDVPYTPASNGHAASKGYIDDTIRVLELNVDTALDEIIELQDKLLEEGTTFDQNNYYTKIEADNTFVTQQDYTDTIGNVNDLLYKLNNGGIV